MKDPNADLKKFITQTVTQSEERLRSEHKIMRQEFMAKLYTFRDEFNDKLDNLRTEMLEGFQGVGDAIENLARICEEDKAYIDKTFTRHDREISILQKQIAPTPNL